MRPPSAAKARPAYKPGTLCAGASLIMNGRIDGASRNISPDQSAVRLAGERLDAPFDVGMLADRSRQNLNAECRGQFTECLKPVARDRITGGDHDDDTRDARRHILEQPQPLPGEGEFEIAEAGNIPGRPSEARDDPLSKRIGHGHEYDRYGLRQPLQRQQRAAWASEDDIRLHLHNLSGMGRDKFKAVATPSELSPDIPSFNPAV